MNPVSKSQASSSLIKNIERNKSMLDNFTIFLALSIIQFAYRSFTKKIQKRD